MALLLKNLRCIDPQVGLNEVCDILIRDGHIVELGKPGTITLPKGEDRDLAGRICVPGLVDMHVHLREPGQEYKEDIASGSRAAASGGFTDVLAMPNTKPTCDDGSRVAFVREASVQVRTRVHVAGALTRGLKGESLAEMGDMHRAGAVAFTDDGRGVQDTGLMRLAMDYAKQFGVPVLAHCQDEALVGVGVVNEGVVSTRLGLAGMPAAGEEIALARDIALAELTGCALHLQHISTAGCVELVRAAKDRGVKLTAEVTPHHLFLCEDALDVHYNSSLKMNPPLRTAEDAKALRAAFAQGVIDVLATDHAPHAAHEKALEFELAPFGTTGLETALALVLTELVATGALTYEQLVERMAVAPRRILGLEPVRLEAGSSASLTIFDPTLSWVAGADGWQSKSGNSAFAGRQLTGRATDVYVAGYASLQNGEVQ